MSSWKSASVPAIAWLLATGCRAIPEHATLPPLASGPQPEAISHVEPSNNRDWSPDVAVLAHVELNGDDVKLHNVRHCTYRADEEYVVKYEERQFKLNDVQSCDFIVVPFKEAQGLAHTMLSFGTKGGDYFSVSVEARLEKGEKYSPVLGFLKQFELVYVVADERDVILRRTLYRGSDVYLYRTRATPEQSRELFVDVAHRINKLYRQPEFYDTLTNNCTTNLVRHANQIRPNSWAMWDPRTLLPGYADRLAFDLGWIDTTKSFEEVKAAAKINERANRFADRKDFSQLIRR